MKRLVFLTYSWSPIKSESFFLPLSIMEGVLSCFVLNLKRAIAFLICLFIYLSNTRLNYHLFRKELLIRFAVCVNRGRLIRSMYASFSISFQGGRWDIFLRIRCR